MGVVPKLFIQEEEHSAQPIPCRRNTTLKLGGTPEQHAGMRCNGNGGDDMMQTFVGGTATNAGRAFSQPGRSLVTGGW